MTGFWCLFGCIKFFRVYTKYIEIVTTTIAAISARTRITEMIVAVLLLSLISTFFTANNNYYDNRLYSMPTHGIISLHEIILLLLNDLTLRARLCSVSIDLYS